MSTNTQYFKVIRKITSSFASLFNNLILIKYNEDGSENQRVLVPIVYANKEKYIKRIQGDPDLDKKIQISLPRISYEMTGMSYDSSRKLITTNANFAPLNSDNILSQYNPIPYNFNFSITIYTRNVEDGNQIIEQILPYFTPDYSLRLNLVPEMGIIKTVPIHLDGVEQTIDSDGYYETEVRTVMWTLGFTIKGFIFGAVKDVPVIRDVTVNLSASAKSPNQPNNSDACCTGGMDQAFMMLTDGNGNYTRNELVYQGLNLENAYAIGKVTQWHSNTLYISETCGTFKLSQPITGADSLTIRVPYANAVNTEVLISMNTVPVPNTASANSYYTTNTTVTYY